MPLESNSSPASAIPRVVCKDYTTWTKPLGCKQVTTDLNFCDARFRLYIEKRVKPQYALNTARYKGRVVIVESKSLSVLTVLVMYLFASYFSGQITLFNSIPMKIRSPILGSQSCNVDGNYTSL